VRVFNVVRTLEPELRGEIVFADILGLAALSVKATPVFDLLQKSPKLFVGCVRSDDNPSENPQDIIKNGIKVRKDAYEACTLPDATQRIVHFLFPQKAWVANMDAFAPFYVSPNI